MAGKKKDLLAEYRAKRDFSKTAEPAGEVAKASPANRAKFVIQKHDASRLHYDLRLEIDGVLKSWAVPKGPSWNPANKRLAVHVEDHPLEYGTFEGTIPEDEYGGGTVMLWDRGTFTLFEGEDALAEYESGVLKIEFHGERMKGKWALIQMHKKGEPEQEKNWLFIKEKDDAMRTEGKDITEQYVKSVKTDRTMKQIAEDKGSATWSSEDDTEDD
jgi:bifunctional non-homologous end joining protein LigD